MKWDGREAKVLLQLSCQGNAQEFRTTVPAYGTPGGASPSAFPLGGLAALGSLLVPGMGDVGQVPGPGSLDRTLTGVLVPGVVGLLGGLVAGLFGGGPATLAGGPPLAPSRPGAESPEGRRPEGDDSDGEKETEAPPPPPRPRRTLIGPDGRDYVIEFDEGAGHWINTETGNIFDLNRFEQWKQDVTKDQQLIRQEVEKASRRGTDFDRQMDRMVEGQREDTETLRRLQQMRKAAWTHDIGSVGGPGDVVGRLDRLIEEAASGKRVDPDEIERVERGVKDRVGGKTLDGSALSDGEYQDRLGDALAETLAKTSREVFAGASEDGSASFKGMAVRALAGVLTLGSSESYFTVADALYKVKDGIDRGESGLSATGKAMVGALWDEAQSRVLSFGITKGPSKLQTVPGSKGLSGGIGKGTTTVGELVEKNRSLKDALSIGDDTVRTARIKELYREGGMKKLAKLEELGQMTAAEAAECNRVITREVNEVVDQGVRKTIGSVESDTGVRIKQVLIGDSGSSAKGGKLRSIKTDADRTAVVVFDDKDLSRYARETGLSKDQAYDQLSKKFASTQDAMVDDALRQRGLSAADVDYKTYSRMGSGAGQADAYPGGFTRTRQAVQGQTTAYRVDDGNVTSSYKTSGQTLIDQEALNQAKLQADGKLPDLTPKVPKSEFSSLVDQQVSALEHAGSSANTAAKALDRAQYVAERMGQTLDPELVQIAKEINRSPQSMAEVLQSHGMTAEEYFSRSSTAVKGFQSWAKSALAE